MLRSFCNYLRGINYDDSATSTQNSYSFVEKILKLKKFFRHFGLIIKIIFPRFFCTSTFLLVFLLIDVVGLEFVVYNVGLIGGKFYKSLTDKNFDDFIRLAFVAIGLIIADALMVSLRDFFAQLMGIVWRKYLTVKLHSLYFSRKNFYYLQKPIFLNANTPKGQNNANFVTTSNPVFDINSVNSVLIEPDNTVSHNTIINFRPINSNDTFETQEKLDNPDQRITQDVNTLCKSLSTILPLILISPFVIVWYTYQLNNNVGYTGPLAVFIYFIIWSMINGPLASPIVKVIYNQDKKEGDFRFKHMNLRTNAESIAFYDSSEHELRSLNQHFTKLLDVSYRRNWKELILKIFVNTSQYMSGIIAYLVLGIPIFTNIYNDLSPADLSQLISNYSFKCQYLIYLFTRLYNTLDEISSIAGNSYRVGELFDKMNENTCNQSKTAETGVVVPQTDSAVCFKTDHLSIFIPDKSRILIKDLSFKLETGQNVLLTGRTGCGKTSLLRCLNGLWSSYTGKLVLSELAENKMFFLPQSSYFTYGSLLEQIIYPTIEESFLKEMSAESLKPFLLQVISWLRKFNLEHLLQKVSGDLTKNPDLNWSSVLSAGEQQRLSFLRIIFHRPKFVLLDECTSSVDQETEALMYQSLVEIQTTFLSIAHRDTVRKYHNIEIKINYDSTCDVVNLS